MVGITYYGLRKCNTFEIANIKNISEEYFPRIVRDYKKIFKEKFETTEKDFKLEVDIKLHSTAGKRRKYSIHIRVMAPDVKVSSAHADFELQRALRRTFDDLLYEINHKYKKEVTQRQKKRYEW